MMPNKPLPVGRHQALQSPGAPRRRRIVRRTILGLSVTLVSGLLTSWLVAGWLIAPVPRSIGRPPTHLPAEPISLASGSGTQVRGWHVPADDSHGVVVLLHGIRGCRLSMLDRAEFLHEAGYSLVMIDLRCHGESPGECITLGHLESRDVKAAVAFARRQYPDRPVAVLGVSLGGASALMASPLDVDALILESVFSDITTAVHNRVAEQLGPLADVPSWLLLSQLQPRLGISPEQLRPIDCLSRLQCPLFLLSGEEDRHTTPSEVRQMFEAAPAPKQLWIVPGAAHVDLHQAAPEEYQSQVLAFLGQQFSPTAK